jgi:hypothetical protein
MWFIPWPHDPEGRAGLVIEAADAARAVARGREWHLALLESVFAAGVEPGAPIDPLDSRYQPSGEPLWGEVGMVTSNVFEIRGGQGERFAPDGN